MLPELSRVLEAFWSQFSEELFNILQKWSKMEQHKKLGSCFWSSNTSPLARNIKFGFHVSWEKLFIKLLKLCTNKTNKVSYQYPHVFYFVMYLFSLFLCTIFYQDFKASIIFAYHLTKMHKLWFLELSSLPCLYSTKRELLGHKIMCNLICVDQLVKNSFKDTTSIRKEPKILLFG